MGSKPLDLCGLARKNLPGNADELIRVAKGTCSCLPKLLDFIDLEDVKSAVVSLDASEGTASILEKFGDSQQVLSTIDCD